MKRHETLLVAVVVVSLLGACTGSSNGTAESTVVPTAAAEPTEIDEATAAPVPTAAPVDVGDQDLIAAAVAQIESDVAAGEGPTDTIAYDIIESSVDPDGNVTLRICAWSGDTVFDTVRDALYRTDVADDGSVTATHVTSPVGPGECLNSTLIDSALDFIDEFDAYWASTNADPASFDLGEAEQFLATEYLEIARQSVQGWEADEIQFLHTRVEGPIRETVVADILMRRFRANDLDVLEFAICRDMDPRRGAYRDGLLVDAGRSEGSPGLHSIDSYQLVIADRAVADHRWHIAGLKAIIWSDCFANGDWVASANIWQERATDFQVLDT